jgi:hypothetical protein
LNCPDTFFDPILKSESPIFKRFEISGGINAPVEGISRAVRFGKPVEMVKMTELLEVVKVLLETSKCVFSTVIRTIYPIMVPLRLYSRRRYDKGRNAGSVGR